MTGYIVVLSLLLLFLVLWRLFARNISDETSESDNRDSRLTPNENILFPPVAPDRGHPRYAIIDVQTNGLVISDKDIPDALQISWMMTDEEFRVISHDTFLVHQEEIGALSARRVHKVSAEQIERYGVTVKDAADHLNMVLREGVTLVFHNAEFDVMVLNKLLTDADATALRDTFVSMHCICTMRFEERATKSKHKYPTLSELTHKITRIAPDKLKAHPVVSWRNVCMTRTCAKALLSAYEERSPLPQKVEEIIGEYSGRELHYII